MHDYHLEMSNRFFHILNILFCHFRYVKSHDHETILSAEYDIIKKGWYSWVTLHLSSLPQRWSIKTILFRQFFWARCWRASMGCFTGISFTTLQPPTPSQGFVYPQPVWGRWVSLERYLRTYKWCLNTANGCLLLGASTDWQFQFGPRKIYVLQLAWWCHASWNWNLSEMSNPCQIRQTEYVPETNQRSFYQDQLKT